LIQNLLRPSFVVREGGAASTTLRFKVFQCPDNPQIQHVPGPSFAVRKGELASHTLRFSISQGPDNLQIQSLLEPSFVVGESSVEVPPSDSISLRAQTTLSFKKI
jgi:hypothetical protein